MGLLPRRASKMPQDRFGRVKIPSDRSSLVLGGKAEFVVGYNRWLPGRCSLVPLSLTTWAATKCDKKRAGHINPTTSASTHMRPARKKRGKARPVQESSPPLFGLLSKLETRQD
jgi:hypothetical protein